MKRNKELVRMELKIGLWTVRVSVNIGREPRFVSREGNNDVTGFLCRISCIVVIKFKMGYS